MSDGCRQKALLASKIRVQTVLQSHTIMAAIAGDPRKECSPAAPQKQAWMGWSLSCAALDFSFMCMAAATAIRKGTKLKACEVLLGAVVLYLSSALACTRFALLRDSQTYTTAAKKNSSLWRHGQMQSATNLLHLKRWAHTAGHLQVFLQVFTCAVCRCLVDGSNLGEEAQVQCFKQC